MGRDVFQPKCCPVRNSQSRLEHFLGLQARHLDRLEGGERGRLEEEQHINCRTQTHVRAHAMPQQKQSRLS